jgi:hypothetical protein
MTTSLCFRLCPEARRNENADAFRCRRRRFRRALTQPFVRYVRVRRRSKDALARALADPRDRSRSRT